MNDKFGIGPRELYADQHTEANHVRTILAGTQSALAFQINRADLAESALYRSNEAFAQIVLPALQSIMETVDMSRLDDEAHAIAADAYNRLCEFMTDGDKGGQH